MRIGRTAAGARGFGSADGGGFAAATGSGALPRSAALSSTIFARSAGSLRRPPSTSGGAASVMGAPFTVARPMPGTNAIVAAPARTTWRPVAASQVHTTSFRAARSSRSTAPMAARARTKIEDTTPPSLYPGTDGLRLLQRLVLRQGAQAEDVLPPALPEQDVVGSVRIRHDSPAIDLGQRHHRLAAVAVDVHHFRSGRLHHLD